MKDYLEPMTSGSDKGWVAAIDAPAGDLDLQLCVERLRRVG